MGIKEVNLLIKLEIAKETVSVIENGQNYYYFRKEEKFEEKFYSIIMFGMLDTDAVWLYIK